MAVICSSNNPTDVSRETGFARIIFQNYKLLNHVSSQPPKGMEKQEQSHYIATSNPTRLLSSVNDLQRRGL